MKVYAAYYDNIIRKSSSSGGIFHIIASIFDVVYGVRMDDDNKNAIYERKRGDITALRGSKYLQAKVGDTFKDVKNDLIKGRRVLFTGTACQVNGLHTFLQKDYPNLFTVDVVCHGVPSPKYWQKFIEGIDLKSINFRSKEEGWQNYGMKLNEEYIPNTENRYMKLYIQNQCVRPSCFECVCKKDKKSDITLGDFWGIDNVVPELNDNKGISLIIVRNNKGQELFNTIKAQLRYKEVKYEDAIRYNPCEYKSTNRPANRDAFFKDMEVMSFEALYKKYVKKPSFVQKTKMRVKKFLRKRN